MDADLFGSVPPSASVHTQQSKSDARGKGDRPDDLNPDERADMERLERLYAGEPPVPCSVELQFRHGGWAADRRRVRAAMRRCCVPSKRLERFDACGGGCVLEMQQGSGRARLRAFYCGDRFCVPCAAGRARRVQGNLVTLCEGKNVRFCTLTLRATDDPLSSTLDRLIRSFARLREHAFWRKAVKGGAYCVEIKRGSGSGKWHVHLHCLLVGSYLSQHELSEAWKVASGGSFIVDIRNVGERTDRIGYVAKYATKGFDRSVLAAADDLDECLCALRGRRVLGTFGCWRSVELERDDQPKAGWKVVGRFADVWARAVDADPWAVGVFRSLGIDVDITREQTESDPPGGYDPPPP